MIHHILLMLFCPVSAFIKPTENKFWVKSSLYDSKIEYQEDYGRGEDHLSAFLTEGDLVVYQGGTWLVDGVEVGDGSDPYFCYALIDTMQLVWTHNCEHGVLRGFKIHISDDDDKEVKLDEPLIEVQFGPEQLIAKIPMCWDESNNVGKLNGTIRVDMWTPIT